MEQNISTIGERLRKARNAKNLTFDNVHELTGLYKSNLSGHEADTSKPSADALILLSNLYGVSTDWILKGDIPEQDQFKEDDGLYNTEHFLRVPNKELREVIKIVVESWEKGDEATKGWIMVQLRMELVEKLKRELKRDKRTKKE